MTIDPYPDLPGAELLDVGVGPGASGEPLELDEADSRLLAALTRPAPPVVTAAEDEPRPGGPGGDQRGAPQRGARGPLAPVFREPT